MYMQMIESKFHIDLIKHMSIFFFFRQIIVLLTDIVYFLACQENNGSDPFDVQILKPNRERQKLVREQNILKQVNFNRKISSI
jgi:hypothetical protein